MNVSCQNVSCQRQMMCRFKNDGSNYSCQCICHLNLLPGSLCSSEKNIQLPWVFTSSHSSSALNKWITRISQFHVCTTFYSYLSIASYALGHVIWNWWYLNHSEYNNGYGIIFVCPKVISRLFHEWKTETTIPPQKLYKQWIQSSGTDAFAGVVKWHLHYINIY